MFDFLYKRDVFFYFVKVLNFNFNFKSATNMLYIYMGMKASKGKQKIINQRSVQSIRKFFKLLRYVRPHYNETFVIRFLTQLTV